MRQFKPKRKNTKISFLSFLYKKFDKFRLVEFFYPSRRLGISSRHSRGYHGAVAFRRNRTKKRWEYKILCSYRKISIKGENKVENLRFSPFLLSFLFYLRFVAQRTLVRFSLILFYGKRTCAFSDFVLCSAFAELP